MQLTRNELVAAFTEWERRYRKEPEKFMSDVYRFTKTTPNDYGNGATDTLLGYLKEARVATMRATRAAERAQAGEKK